MAKISMEILAMTSYDESVQPVKLVLYIPSWDIVFTTYRIEDITLAQRKLSRNIAITTEVKTGVNFNCPEEFGYYPHPDDCTQYYVCVFGGALLESCTGGLMYSHELQTCDWPRNVGCDGTEFISGTTSNPTNPPITRQREEYRSRYTPPPPPQPIAQVTSRGQPRQLHQQQNIIKQQQLYDESEESLPPAEEVENDRQQRFYRGQPSTIGQVQRDRDGLRHTNAIPYNAGQKEKIGVISFGIHQPQQQSLQQYRELTDNHVTLKNDLTLNRRRKRQTKTSHHLGTTAGVYSYNPYSSRGHYSLTDYSQLQHALRPPLRKPNVKTSKSDLTNYHFKTELKESEEFQPFVPQIYQVNTPASSYDHKYIDYHAVPLNHRKPTTTHSVRDNYAFYNPVESFTLRPLLSGSGYTKTTSNTHTTTGFQTTSSPIFKQTQISHIPTNLYSTTEPTKDMRYTQAVTSTYVDKKKSYSSKSVDNHQFEHDLNEQYEFPERNGNPNKLFTSSDPIFESNRSSRVTNIPLIKTVHIENQKTRIRDKPITTTRDNNPGMKYKTNIHITSTNIVPTGAVKSNIKSTQDDDYYYEEEYFEPKAKLMYSSQIKPSITGHGHSTLNKKPYFKDDYYYYEYDYIDNLEDDRNNFENGRYYNKTNHSNIERGEKKNVTRQGEMKYSARYKENSDETTPALYEYTSVKVNAKLGLSNSNFNPSTSTKQQSARENTSSKTTPFKTSTKVTTTQATPKTVLSKIKDPKTRRTTTISPNKGKDRQRQSLTKAPTHDQNMRRDNAHRVEPSATNPPQESAPLTVTSRAIYNTSQYSGNSHDPYQPEYTERVKYGYKDVDFSRQSNYNNPSQTQQSSLPNSYRRTPAPIIQATPQEEIEVPKRGTVAIIQPDYNSRDIYQHEPNLSEYTEEDIYDNQEDDQNTFRQSNRQQPIRGDRNELNFIEEKTSKTATNRVSVTTTSTTLKPTKSIVITPTTTARSYLSKKNTIFPSTPSIQAKENQTQVQPKLNPLPGNAELSHNTVTPITPIPEKYSFHELDNTQTLTSNSRIVNTVLKPSYFVPVRTAIVGKPAPFSLSRHLTSENPITFHYITKPPTKSTDHVSLVGTNIKYNTTRFNNTNQHSFIVPTTYSPPKFFLKSILPKSSFYNTFSSPDFIHHNSKPSDQSVHTTETDESSKISETNNKFQKTLRNVRKFINPITFNRELSPTEEYEIIDSQSSTDSSDEAEEYSTENIFDSATNSVKKFRTTTGSASSTFTPTSTLIPTRKNLFNQLRATKPPLPNFDYFTDHRVVEKLRHYIEPSHNVPDALPQAKRFRNTVEIPPIDALLSDQITQKPEPDEPPSYKLKPIFTSTISTTTIMTKTDSPLNASLPVRASRVNAAIKSMIAIGGPRRQTAKCNETSSVSNCSDSKRVTNRGRGAGHYSTGNIATNEVTVNTNRGTPPPRSRPTLKPSTAIVSKAAEFIDIYRFPPTRPDPIYPQPQPDKTAAKCRKDVCLLPDCNCGGKEIPGDLPAEQLPQIVLLTFDDSVNDLNKGLYSDLFEKNRVNPNGCPIAATFYVSHEWTDYSQVQNLYSEGHEIASHTVSHSFGEQFSQKKWTREIAGQREILSAYGGVHLEDVRGMRAPFLSVGGNKMFKMLYDSNFTYDSSMPIYENKPPSWPYTLDYKLFHDCMIPPCPTRSYPGVWEVPMVMWQDLNGGRCSMGDACSNPQEPTEVYKMIMKNFQRHYTTNRAPFGLFYHAAWFTQPHHKEGFINFLDSILELKDVWVITNWQALQWVRDPTPTSRLGSFQPFQCDFSDRPKRCNNPKVCNLWHKSGVRYMRTCQPCPDIYPWTGNSGIRSSRIDNDIED